MLQSVTPRLPLLNNLMRVIAGSHRGRRLSGPQGTMVRPTSDKVREALFSILGARVPGSRFLDLYAGTGAVGIEALSRGANTVTFVEADLNIAQLLRKNLTACQFMDQSYVQAKTVKQFLQTPGMWQGPYDVLFADPPYAVGDAAGLVLGSLNTEFLVPDALIVLEQDARAQLPETAGFAMLVRRYVYGDTALFVYRWSRETMGLS